MCFYFGFGFIKRSCFKDEHNAIHATVFHTEWERAMAKQDLLIIDIDGTNINK